MIVSSGPLQACRCLLQLVAVVESAVVQEAAEVLEEVAEAAVRGSG